MIKKITHGYVIQTFDEELISQEFIAGDEVDYEDEHGNEIDPTYDYAPFDMAQPKMQSKSIDTDNYDFVGKNVLICAKTTGVWFWMGRCLHKDEEFIYLNKSSWIPCLGRHYSVMNSGKMDDLTECECNPDYLVIRIKRNDVRMISNWPYPLWRKTK